MQPPILRGLAATTTPAHLTVDPAWGHVTAIAFGRVDDGLPRAQCPVLDEDERIAFLLDAPGSGPLIGFTARDPHAIDVAALTSEAVWDGPRFDVPALALTQASVGEILAAVQARFEEDEPTADALHFHCALEAAGADEPDLPAALGHWRLALEAGDMKALFGLGCLLVDLGRPREAYDLLRRYSELTPHNAWAWCWLGRACAARGETAEARAAFRRALACEREGFETDASDLLEGLPG
jgi:tetratricopeptide (TPR) repeat protein